MIRIYELRWVGFSKRYRIVQRISVFSVSCTPLLCLNAAGPQNLRTRFSYVLCQSSFESSRSHHQACFSSAVPIPCRTMTLIFFFFFFDEVDCTFVALIQSAGALFFFEKLFHRQLCCSRTGQLLKPLPTMDQDSERLRM